MILDSFKLDGKIVVINIPARDAAWAAAMAVRFANCGADIVAAGASTVAQPR